MSSIESYLKQAFERRVIKELQGNYQGPKKLKASGKAAGSKKKKQDKKSATGKSAGKSAPRKTGKRSEGSAANDGFAAPKRKKPAPAAD